MFADRYAWSHISHMVWKMLFEKMRGIWLYASCVESEKFYFLRVNLGDASHSLLFKNEKLFE